MPKQKEFENLPERTPLGKKVIEYIDLLDNRKKISEEIDNVKQELVELFTSEGKTSIKVSGYTISYSHVEKDQIKVAEAKGE